MSHYVPMKLIWRGLRDWVRDGLINGLVNSRAISRFVRWAVLRALGFRIEKSVIASGLYVGRGRLSIGRGSFLNNDVFIDTTAPVQIGAHVSIGMRVTIITGSHERGPSQKRAGAAIASPVSIGDGCWIGAGATILPGVSIGSGCIIAAGSVVTKDCQPNGEYVGVPARRRAELTEPVGALTLGAERAREFRLT